MRKYLQPITKYILSFSLYFSTTFTLIHDLELGKLDLIILEDEEKLRNEMFFYVYTKIVW